MGKNLFVIADADARFGREGSNDPIRLHLALSPSGASQLRDSLLESAGRDKPSAIECDCRIDERDRARRATFRAFSRMRWVVQAKDDDRPTRFDESTDPPSTYWNRRELPKAIAVCERLIAK